MASRQATAVIGHIRKLVAAQQAKQLSDRQLLRRFVDTHDEAAFAALVRRHGPMVLSACQRVLHRTQDAEDACQATFLVLARKAASERWQESIANWLYGVARRLALKARASAARRNLVEHGATPRAPADPLADITARELQTALDEELSRLPEKYRGPILLCCLEGHARDEAAQQLGWTLPTLKSRLEQARELLRRRLTRRGLTLSAGLAALTLAEPASAAFPSALAKGTCQAALALIAGQGSATSLLSPGVVALVDSATRAMLFTKTKIATLVLVAATIAAVGGALLAPQSTGTGSLAAQQDLNADAGVDDKNDMVTISGRVLDPDGKPFEGAELTVCWDWHRRVLKPVKPKVQAKSGPDGRFTFTFSKSTIDARSLHWRQFSEKPYLQIVAAADGYAPAWEIIRGSEAKELTLSLVKDDVPIEGRVVDLQGRPVVSAAVWVDEYRKVQATNGNQDWNQINLFQHVWKGLPDNVTTDKDGRFRLAGLGRSRMVRLCVTGPTIERVLKFVPTIPALYGNKDDKATVEIIAGPTKPITGVVRAKDTGKPLAGVVVHGQETLDGFFWSDGVRTLTDEHGRYRLVGLPKTAKYSLMAYAADGQPYLTKWLELGDNEGLKPIIKDFDLERGVALRLRFIDHMTGKPVSGIVQYSPCYDNPRYNEAHGKNAFLYERLRDPDNDGVFNFLVVPGPSIFAFTAGPIGEKAPYLPAQLNPEDLKAHPEIDKRHARVGGLKEIEYSHAYRLIDAQPDDKPLILDIPVYPKH